jgi:small subunit ribosomal protein S8
MTMTDPVADMLTRIRNATAAGQDAVEVLSSNINREIAKVLLAEGFVRAWKEMKETTPPMIRIHLKYGERGERILRRIQRVSRPGRRVYRGAEELTPFLEGTGIFIVSTPKGVLSDRQCRRERVGGEVLCQVW